MEKISLAVDKRTLEGKKVKQLRRKGFLPANVFGKGVKSQMVQLATSDFLKLYKKAGETHLIELKLDSSLRNVLIHNLQTDPVTDLPLHVDFQEVSLKEKTTATVPIKLVGESPAEKEKIGILVQPLTELEIEALPLDIPEYLEADVSGLTAIDSSLLAKDLRYDSDKVSISPEDLEKIVAKVEPPSKEEVTPVVPAAETAPQVGSETPAPSAEAATEEEKK